MQVRRLAVVAVVVLVLLSGCVSIGGPQGNESANETDAGAEDTGPGDTEPDNGGDTDGDTPGGDDSSGEPDNPGEPDGTGPDETDPGSGDTDTPTDTEAGPNPNDDTANAEWSPPKEPNRPMEDKREGRIKRVEFVDKVPAQNGEGYSNFNLEVHANTSMENVDPPEHGDVAGEPYFFVKINEETDKIVERTDQVRMDEDGTFHIDVRPAGIQEYGEGPLTVEVFLMDKDKEWDDIHGSIGEEIYFNPE